MRSANPPADPGKAVHAVRGERGPAGRSRRLVVGLLAFTALLLVVDAALTALYLGREPAVAVVVADGAGAAGVAARFYAAVDAALQTGNTEPVAELLAPEFAQYPARDGVPRGRTDLLAGLDRLRTLAPGLRLRVDAVSVPSADGGVTVHLAVSGAESGAFLGLPLPTELAAWGWGPTERLRIRDGLVVERWGAADSRAAAAPVAQTGLPFGGPAGQWIVALLRLTLASHAAVEVHNVDAARLLVSETGTVAITVYREQPVRQPPYDGRGPVAEPSPIPADPPIGLAAGDDLLTVPAEHYQLANIAEQPASLLVVVRAPAIGTMDAAGAFIPRVRVDPVAADEQRTGASEDVLGIALVPRVGPEVLELGRVELAPGATLTWPAGDRPILLAVDRGQIRLTADRPGFSATRADGGSWSADEAYLPSGGSASLFAPVDMAWRTTSGEPAVVFVLTLSPDSPERVVAATPAG